MLAVFVVNNFGDLNGDQTVVVGSLRQAVQESNAEEGRDQIIFADYLFDGGIAGSIGLDGRDAGGELVLSDVAGVDIIGPGPGLLTIFAGGNNRIFAVDDGSDTVISSHTISGVTLSGGSPDAEDRDGQGGAVFSVENLTLTEVDVDGNFAPNGGGGVFVSSGFTTIDRSLIRNNTSQTSGGGVQNGVIDQDDNLPTVTIQNTTLTGNTAIGIPVDDTPTGYGGGVFSAAGTANIEQSTIYGNQAANYGGGSATQGFDPETDDMGMATVSAGLAYTNIRSSIIVGNTAMGVPDDVGSAGMTEADDMTPAMPFEPQINSEGFNLFGVLSHPPMSANPNILLPPQGSDATGVDPSTVFIDDPTILPPAPAEAWLNDFGGVLPVFMPDLNKAGGQMAIDMGDDMNVQGALDNRGFGFSRVADLAGGMMPVMDIGAAEVQAGIFEVNTLVDESDGRFADVVVSDGFFPINFTSFVPDFSLREALEFALKNQDALDGQVNTITFSTNLTNEVDPTLSSPEPTILLTQGSLDVLFPVIIEGPTLFGLEIDATGNDPTPGIDNADGSRVFNIFETVEINNLIIRGGDQQEFGGAISTFGDLTLTNVTIKDNFTSGKGAGIYVASGTLLIESSTIHDNEAASSGGGVFLYDGDVTISNSTISGNDAGLHGGGLANEYGNLDIRYSTVTLNTASSTLGSGLASYRNGYAATTVRSSIISGNTVNDVQHIQFGADSIVSLGYNLVGTGNAVVGGVFSASGDQTFTDAMLAPLARLGGPTPVHRLLPGSPAIDAGDLNNAGLGNVPDNDQRGFPFDRIEPIKDENGNVIDPGQIDIGSYEKQDDVLLVGDGSPTEGSFTTFFDALTESNLTPEDESIVFLPTWAGETFPGNLSITDSVEVLGLLGFRFFGSGISGLEILIDDGDAENLLDVSFDSLRFDTNVRFVSKENLTLTNMTMVDNTYTAVDLDNDDLPDREAGGGVLYQEDGTLTIEDSNFIGNSTTAFLTVLEPGGGAIYAKDAEVVINNTLMSGNTTGALGGNGGAIFIEGGTLTATNLYITGGAASAATAQGGGLYAKNSTVMLTNAIISGNFTSGSNSGGGAIAGKDSDITLTSPALSFNTTTGSQSNGGAVHVEGGSLTITDGTLLLNETRGHTSSGGAIASLNADVVIERTSIDQNNVTGDNSHGGGVHAEGGTLEIRDSTISNSIASGDDSKGGGLFTDMGPIGSQGALLINSTVSGNTADDQGGGIYNAGGLLQIQFSTITNSSVPFYGDGPGVASFADAATTTTEVLSSIIAGNTTTAPENPPGQPNPDSDVDLVGGGFTNSFASLGFNVVGSGEAIGAFTGTGDQTGIVDPGLADLGFNGGPTQTHELTAGSVALNAGDQSAMAGVNGVPDNDQRGMGNNRVFGSAIDVGAFESTMVVESATLTAPEDIDEDGMVSGLDFLLIQMGLGTPNATKADGDTNNDQMVDSVDIANWNSGYGTVSNSAALGASSTPAIAAAIISPEPESASLAASSEPVVASSSISQSAVSSQVASPSANQAEGTNVFITSLRFTTPDVVWNDPFGGGVREAVLEQFGQALNTSPRELIGPFASGFGDITADLFDLFEEDEADQEFREEDVVFEELGEAVV